MGIAKIVPVSDYEVGLWLRERQAQLTDAAAREQDRLLRLCHAVQEARIAVDLRERDLERMRADLERFRKGTWSQGNQIRRLQKALAQEVESKGRRRS